MKKLFLILTIPLFFIVFLGVFSKKTIGAGASLFLEPSSQSFKVGETFSLKLMVDTAGVAINAGQATIYFPSELVEVTKLLTDDSIFYLWAEEPVFSNTAGRIYFTGGLPTPGFKGLGNLITIEFKAKKEGDLKIIIDDARVLADDGQGTNVMSYIKEGKYSTYQKEPFENPRLQPRVLPEIFSSSHPKQDEWFNNNSPVFQWRFGPEIKGVSFILDNQANTLPDNISEGLLETKNYEKISDGVWYFHLRFEDRSGWGETSHHKIQIDSQPPHLFEIAVDNAGDPTNPKPNLYFETQDDISGVTNYKIKIGEENFLDLMMAQINPFPLPAHPPGSYRIIVRAQDKARNLVQAKTRLEIAPLETPVISIWPGKYIAGEETLYIEGQALPETEVTIILKSNEKEIKKWRTISDAKGDWLFSTRELLKPGFYTLSAKIQDKRGAESQFSEEKPAQVILSGLFLGPVLVSFKTLVLILIFVSVIVILILFLLYFQTKYIKKILRKETKEVKESFETAFERMGEEIEKQIEMFDEKAGFTPKEKAILDKLKESLKTSRERIEKEIKDVEKELK